MTEPIKLVGPEYLAEILGLSVFTVKTDVTRRPESLPPRLIIPGRRSIQWLESDVVAWLKACSTAKPAPKGARRVSSI